ncbi:MAG: hypothetical protein GX552_12715 [Chloroflexi bacterium]|nr:hypothetical protein [Chloroflexota bacterium]
METVLPPLAVVTLQTFVAVHVGWRYRVRPTPQRLLWGLALLLLAVGSGCRCVGEWLGWSALLYRLWYLAAVLLPVAYLGQGAVYLLAGRRAAHITLLLLLGSTAVAVWAVLCAPLNPTLTARVVGLSAWAESMPPVLHGLALAFHFFGVLPLIAVLWWSLWNRWKRGSDSVPGSVNSLGALLLLLGAVVASLGGRIDPSWRFVPAMGQVAGAGLVCWGGALIGRSDSAGSLAAMERRVRRLRQRRRRHVRRLSRGLR